MFLTKKYSKDTIINLHIHSNYSNGDYDSKMLVKIANDQKYSVISVTDHDCYDAQLQISTLCKNEGISYIFGCENTSFYKGNEIHILSYYKNMPSNDYIALTKSRRISIEVIKRRCRKKQYSYTNFNDTINEIHANGGIAILAHPQYYVTYEEIFESFDGFELLHPDNSLKLIEYLYCQYDNYLFTCGTDLYKYYSNERTYKILQREYNEMFVPFLKEFGINI